MLNQSAFLAAIELKEDGSGIFAEMTREGKERLLILGTVFLAAVLALILYFVVRKLRRRYSHRHHHRPAELKRYRRHKHEDEGLLSLLRPTHRRRKRRFLHRNPTLAETGGLPPARPEDVPPPGPKAPA